MKKVLLAFDGNHFSDTVFEFVKQMNSHQPVFAVGFFLPAVDYAELLYSFGGVPAGPIYITEAVPGNSKIVKENIIKFRKLCVDNGISFAVHDSDTDHVMNMIRDETRYADLLLVDGKTFYENLGDEVHQEYVVNTLHKSECPVMIIPGNFHQPQSLIFSYDGTEQSVFAIKQFYYLFPFYSGMQVFLVFFASKEKDLPKREKIYELLKCYYKDITIIQQNIHHKDEIEEWLLKNRDPIFITGAYGRSQFSQFVHHSFVSTIMKNSKLFVFIAHK
jgi:hypothetical protein